MGPDSARYSDRLYRGGWILTQTRDQIRSEWPRHAVGDYLLSCSKETPITKVRTKVCCLVVLGRPVDAQHSSADGAVIAQGLAQAAGEGGLEDALDQLAGRFVVIIDHGDGPQLYQDAAGARAVFYRRGVAASHSALAARDPERQDGDVLRLWDKVQGTSQGVRYLPGVRAPHEGVWMLTPNTTLHVPTGTVRRFWPRIARQESEDTDATAGDVACMLSKTAVCAAESWPLLCSLSAGIDSRLTLAACHQVAQKITFFSHIDRDQPKRIHVTDLAIARDIADQCGLVHRVFEMGAALKGADYDDFYRVWLANLGIPRGIPTLIKSYVNSWPSDALHLRSNIAEVGRVFYKGPRLNFVTPAGLTRWWNPDLAADRDAVDSFAEFCNVSSFNDSTMLGYDPLDLFYWEHRMGSWHAWLCLEADIVHDTFPIYSNRRLLDTMLSAPFDVRESAVVFHRAIEKLWPELSAWPINPKRRNESWRGAVLTVLGRAKSAVLRRVG